MSSPVEESYLETIYNMSMEDGLVRAVDLAEKFKVSRPTVAQTLRKLSDEGLVTQDRTTGIQLSSQGRDKTEGLLRRHRLAERLMFDVLGMDFISAHEQAHALEHWISPEVEERISGLLGSPATCPHGNPIPGNAPGGVEYLRHQHAFRLHAVEPGRTVTVVSISEVVEDETALLRELLNTGVVPGGELEIHPGIPRTDMIEYTTRGSAYQISRDLATKIWVRPG
ncbi:MAG TPA: metal-dependent transcriptional regulator [Chloroflexota bacterium]|nr:metal-dependent transcriptional regulator [Chloroflexota bacterium]